jgi:hypothetical protein
MMATGWVETSMKRPLEVRLSDFAIDALARGEPRESEEVRRRFGRAIRLYLHDADADRPGWSVPSALREERTEVAVKLELDHELQRRLEAEARKQGVSPSRLVSQAVIYYAAELDAGRVTRRLLDDLGEDA